MSMSNQTTLNEATDAQQPQAEPFQLDRLVGPDSVEALILERGRARAAIRFTLASDDYDFDLVEAIESLVDTLEHEEAGHAETLALLKLREAEIARLLASVV